MIASLAITASAMGDLRPVATEEALYTVHRQLLQAIARHALLVASPEDWDRFTIAVECLDDSERHEWEVLIASLREHDRIRIADHLPCLDDAQTLTEARAALPRGHAVGVLGADAATALGIDAQTGFLSVGTHELVRSRRSPEAPRLNAFAAIAGRGMYPKLTSRDTVFDEVLKPLAQCSQDVVIADQYLYNPLVRRGARDRRSTEMVGWMLNRLSRHCPPGSTVTLIGGVGDQGQPATAAGAAELVRAAWNPSRARVERVTVLGANWKGERLAHDRHLMFGCGMAVKFNAGLDRLRDPQLWDEDGTWWTHVWNPVALAALRDSEGRMRAATGRGVAVPNPMVAGRAAAR